MMLEILRRTRRLRLAAQNDLRKVKYDLSALQKSLKKAPLLKAQEEVHTIPSSHLPVFE